MNEFSDVPDSAAPDRSRYHHGSLREAVIEAGLGLLEDLGSVQGFSLREVARRAGVSPAAPAHHFGGITGVFSSIAARGFLRLDVCIGNLLEQAAPTEDPVATLRTIASGYLEFARNHRALFRLMFDCEKLDWDQEDLKVASSKNLYSLNQRIQGQTVLKCLPWDSKIQPASQEVIGIWAILHGFAHLLIDNQLSHFAGPDRDPMEYAVDCLAAILNRLVFETGEGPPSPATESL
jgi:AcrR family transcriptional regulator